MDFFVLPLSLAVFLLGWALFANRARKTAEMPFDLKPNCLLTRWPIIFLTGPRSLFYFRRYWNLYPVFLAEHGYEIYTVHLPWKNRKERRQRLELFLKKQTEHGKPFHLVLDTSTWKEFSDLLEGPPQIASVTEISNPLTATDTSSSRVLEMSALSTPGFLLGTSYRLHGWLCGRRDLPSLSTLAALQESALDNSRLLLEHFQTVAEMDLRENR